MGDPVENDEKDVILDEKAASESDDLCISQSNKEALKDLPEVLNFINRLQECILRQRTLIHKLYHKFKEVKGNQQKITIDVATQTCQDELISTVEPAALVEDIKKAAENAVQQSGFVYEETSGMYYDYNTGYYYNAEHGLYYDGKTGAYYYFDETTKTFHFHSQVSIQQSQSVSENEQLNNQPQTDSIQQSNSQLVSNSSSYLQNTETTNHIHSQLPCSQSDANGETKPVDSKTNLGKRSHHDSTKIIKKIKTEVKEDGECSESSSESELESDEMENENKGERPIKVENSDDSRVTNEETNIPVQVAQTPLLDSDEIAAAWPPCLRVVVVETGLEDLPVGTLFVVTCTGGSVGREGDHSILIPDISISKHHARVTFSESARCYQIVDLGSRNGTYVDGRRVSVAMRESEPVSVAHGTELKLGSTRLQCHVHPGRDTCDGCEPGCTLHKTPAASDPADKDHETREARHRSELRRLRKRFGLDKLTAKETSGALAAGYLDRAEERRKTVGSQDHHAKTETASVHESIKSTNKGFKMLSKMGWAKGQSLGKDSSKGITEPVTVEQRANKAGLGSDVARLPAADARDKRRTEMWKKAQKRFQELNDDSDDDAADQ